MTEIGSRRGINKDRRILMGTQKRTLGRIDDGIEKSDLFFHSLPTVKRILYLDGSSSFTYKVVINVN